MPPVELALSIDVEEEGLFRGSYARRASGVRNVAELARLSPLLEEFDLPISLLCTHSVLSDDAACRSLATMCARHRVEIGAHLHHWNTPPLDPDDAHDYVSPGRVPEALLAARLATLFAAGADFWGRPLTSFRMGKWDLHRWHWPLLAEAGVLVDASVRPLHYAPRGPDHFAAPADPYQVMARGHAMLEAPLSCVPLCTCVRRLHAPGAVGARGRLAASVQKWGALPLLPAYQPLWLLKAVTRACLARGLRVLSLSWHSSEMLPGAAPHVPDVDRFVRKIRAYLGWLRAYRPLRGRTLDDLRQTWNTERYAPRTDERGGDWRY